MRVLRCVIAFACLFFLVISVGYAQTKYSKDNKDIPISNDSTQLNSNSSGSTNANTDTTTKHPHQGFTPPKKALLLSLIPGGGQIYNHKYWKVPVIYAAIGTLTYFAYQYQSLFKSYGQSYTNAIVNNTQLSQDQLDFYLTNKNDAEKYRNNCIVAIIGVYFLNLVDAAVDAHLKNFDVSPVLSQETMINFKTSIGKVSSPGIHLTYQF